MSIWDDYKGSSLNPLNMFSHDDPSKAANNYLNQIPGVGHKNYDPFVNEGKTAGGILQGEYGKQLDPTTFMDQIMQHYNQSAGAKYKTDLLGRGIGSTAAAGGIAGTPEHQREYGQMASDISSEDMQKYFDNTMGIYNNGIKGEQDVYGHGFDATKELTDLLGGTLSSQAGGAYGEAQSKNADRQALMQALIKALSQGAGVGA